MRCSCRRQLREHHVEHELHVVKDGLQAERHSNRIGQSDDALRPDVPYKRPSKDLPHRYLRFRPRLYTGS